jgi:hypothetical protein
VPGRRIPAERDVAIGPYARPDFARRREVLRETLASFERGGDHLRALAQENLRRWANAAAPGGPRFEVRAGDWGEVTAELTRAHGVTFAVLNMANAYVPGGAYVEGAPAQEENLFRRTDCHFFVDDAELEGDRYTEAMTARLSAEGGRVYLDVDRPRTCVRGPEDRSRPNLGYRWLAEDEVFPIYELRASAQDLGGGQPFDEAEARRRIAAQLDTLADAGVRHAVLSAFGCGAFQNPADRVARIYRRELDARADRFDKVAFAIFDPGYGPDNLTPFRATFADAA